MKYVITGGAGHISKPLTEALLSNGHEVTVISRNEKNVEELVAKGAKAAIGSIEDADFLTKAFAGADAVYTMVPPNFAVSDWKAFIANTGKLYADAIKASNVKYVVNLSSIGAHMPEGCGPVSGMHFVEQHLNSLSDVNVLHLRPSYFYYNLYNNIGLIKHMGIVGGNYGSGTTIPMVDTSDIANVAAEALLKLNFTGHTIKYIASDEATTDEIAVVLGDAINKPELKWVDFTDEQSLDGMKQAGLPQEIAENFVEMGKAMRTGEMFADYKQHHIPVTGKVKLEDFAKGFAAAYHN